MRNHQLSTDRIRGKLQCPVPLVEPLEIRTFMSVAVNQAFWANFAGDAQHSAISAAPSQDLQSIHWQTKVDLSVQLDGSEITAHYGSPVITEKNTVIVPVKTTADGAFEVEAIDGATGKVKWKFASDFIPSAGFSTQSFSPALTRGGRLYLPGAGGTVFYLDNVDSNTVPVARRLAFYGSSNYAAHKTAFNDTVFINTPLTISKSGTVYFGFQVARTNPLNLQSGIARISQVGHGIWVSAAVASGDPTASKIARDCAPALSGDGKRLYLAVNPTSPIGAAIIRGAGNYLLCLDAASLRTIGKVRLKDPETALDSVVPDGGSASPTVGPDGDVYFGVLESTFGANNGRGWLLHFNSTLTTEKTPGSFGWDDTASIVSASMVKSYHGKSSYLVLTKYNNYAGIGTGDGVNKIAVLDPNTTQTNPTTGTVVMKEVETIAGVTPDTDHSATNPGAVKEWCVNTVVIDPATDSALVNSEDGKLYRWNLSSNKLTETIRLTSGAFEAYTPTAMGPDGTVYAMQDAILFAVGKKKV